MKIHMMNTDRMYSRLGQRIGWTDVGEGWVVFVDVDRHIDGAMRVHADPTHRHVLKRYDYGDYQGGFCEGLSQTEYLQVVREIRTVIGAETERGRLDPGCNDLTVELD